MSGGGITSSTATGRLRPRPPAVTGATIESYLYSETSSTMTFGDTCWGRSGSLNLSDGDIIELLVGIDAPTVDTFTAYVGAS